MADTTIVADNATLVAENIQSKVGATLLGVGAAAKDTVKVSRPTETLLDSIRNLQEQTVAKITEVWEILQAQLDFEKDEARRLREKDPLGKGKGLAGAAGVGGLNLDGDEQKKAPNKILAWIAANPLFSAAGAISAFKLFGMRLIKGGFWGIVAKMLGDQLVDMLDLEKGSISAEALGTYIPVGIAGAMMAGPMGALVAVAATGLASVGSWLLGGKEFKEISTFDWGAAAIGGGGVVAAGVSKLGSLMTAVGVKGGGLAKLGMLLGSTPMLLAVGIGAAAVVGGIWLAGKVGEYKETMLTDLAKTAKQTQQQFEDHLTKQKTTFLDKIGLGAIAGALGFEQTQLEETRAGTSGALKKVQKAKEGEKDKALTATEQKSLIATAEQFIAISPDSLKTILKDKHSTHDYMESMNNMMILAQEGAFGPQESARILAKILRHQQTIQSTSAEAASELKAGGDRVPAYLTDVTLGRSDWGGDVTERMEMDKEQTQPIRDKITSLQAEMDKLDKTPENRQKIQDIQADLNKENYKLGVIEKGQEKRTVEGLDWQKIEMVLGSGVLQEISTENMKIFAKMVNKKGALLTERNVVPPFISTNVNNNIAQSDTKHIGIHANNLHMGIRNNDHVYKDVTVT